jgi:hypothetical protein
MLLGIPDALVSRDPGHDLPTIAQLVADATTEERARVTAIQAAIEP